MNVSPQRLQVEMPSGKDAAYENFPVGSWLLPAALRPHIARFYAFARAIDDIADSPALAPEEKIRRLDGFGDAICGRNSEDSAFVTGHVMRRSLLETGVSSQHCLDLISAFKQDAVKHRYIDWADLMDYCLRSAAPVGRFLLDLHGGASDGYTSSDALCNALQVINHLQDCEDDYRRLDRVYLPGDWLAAAGAPVTDLGRPACSAALRRVIDRCLDATERLLCVARPLPTNLRSRRLAMESAAILDIATTLVGRLRAGDPLQQRIQLGKFAFLTCCARGAAAAWFGFGGRRAAATIESR